ncbi:MAG: uroporphyrinogen-III synthase [Zoogloeaceae bacterium]|nr:uroporphyrinogen-III synthase [Zoogloeaceae bacterium]MCK6384940.1 uroporphyrinogen-III synthase [Rhodocyclaceae bacterium]
MSVLRGKHVVVTRPAEQADKLAGQIEARGGTAVRFPVLAIFDVADPGLLRAAAQDIEGYDFAIFVSPNAAQRALGAITAQRAWPERVIAAAMGEASARAIARFGVSRIVTPLGGRHDSEALLERPEFAPAAICGKRVALFRGDAGRELLGQTLEARGAKVTRIPCYRRGRPELDARPLRRLLAQGRIDAVTVTSSEGLRNLLAMVGAADAQALKAVPLFVGHQRIAGEARAMGFAETVVTAPGDAGLLAGLETRFGGKE